MGDYMLVAVGYWTASPNVLVVLPSFMFCCSQLPLCRFKNNRGAQLKVQKVHSNSSSINYRYWNNIWWFDLRWNANNSRPPSALLIQNGEDNESTTPSRIPRLFSESLSTSGITLQAISKLTKKFPEVSQPRKPQKTTEKPEYLDI